MYLQRDPQFISRNCHGLARMAFESSSVMNLVYSYKATQKGYECSVIFLWSYQRGLFLLFLSPSFCRLCLQNHTNHNDARSGQYYFNWNLPSLSICSCSCEDSRVPQLNRYSVISIAGDPYCSKAVDSTFFRNIENITRMHSSLFSWAGVSEQITSNVLFWLHLSEI